MICGVPDDRATDSRLAEMETGFAEGDWREGRETNGVRAFVYPGMQAVLDSRASVMEPFVYKSRRNFRS